MDSEPEEEVVELEAAEHEEGTPLDEGSLTSVPMTELQRYRLQATEMTLELRKFQACAEVDKKYAVLRALEIDRVSKSNLAVKQAQRESNEAVNLTLTELEADLPEGYSLTNLEWENGVAHVEDSPKARGQRLPVE